METITFYSYKGGTGRTLLVAHTARFLALSGKRVVAVDLDFEAPGLHYRLLAAAPVTTGVVDYLAASLEQHRAPVPPLTDFVLPVAVPDDSAGQLWLLPAGPAPSGDYWKQVTRLHRLGPLIDPEGVGLAAILDLKARIEDELEPDYLLLDARTGITEVGGVATSVLADKVVCLMVDNQESLDGTRAVLEGLRRAQRLSGQATVKVFPVLSRVTGDIQVARNGARTNLIQDGSDTAKTEELYVIRADPRVETGRTERPRSGPPRGAHRDYRFLLNALLPVGPDGVSPAWARHVAVQNLVEWLTDGYGKERDRPRLVPATFATERIEEGLRIGVSEGRYADVVAFASADRTEPLLAAEYVGAELKASTAWAWWQEHTELRCVILFGADQYGMLIRRVFTRGRQGGPFTDRGDQWGVHWPSSFTAFDDPGDRSVASMIKAVQNGEDGYLSLLITDWQHATWFGIRGGFTPDPREGAEIMDGLASVRSERSELEVLWRTAASLERDGRREHERAGMEEHTTRELHAPLWWRLSADAKATYWRGMERTTAGVQLLASEVLGLAFDQDRDFRAHAAPLGGIDMRKLRGIYQELEFAISDEASPELVRLESLDPVYPDNLGELMVMPPDERRKLAEAALLADATLDRLLRDPAGNPGVVTTNLLGNYEPAVCRVVLYRPIVAWCAKAINVDQRALENVVLLHETVHALCHIGLDLDGNRWDEFALPPSTHPRFRPSALHEGLAQYFTFRMLERLDDALMTEAFERLTDVQPPEYQQWRTMRSVPLERAREVLLRARAGSAGSMASLLEQA